MDNDVVLKTVCYDLWWELLNIYLTDSPIGILGAARYIVAKRIQKYDLACGHASALTRLNLFLANADAIEPTESESFLAAEFEMLAQQQGVALDSGESQLLAVAISRAIPWLLTGDKRAIRGCQLMLGQHEGLSHLHKKVVCLEQLVKNAAIGTDARRFRNKICAEPKVDKTLSICFSCSSVNWADWMNGLESYISALRSEASKILSD